MPDFIKRNALMLIMASVAALSLASLAGSVLVWRESGRTVDLMLASYVADLADAYAADALWPEGEAGKAGKKTERYAKRFFRRFDSDPSIRSSGLILYDSRGALINRGAELGGIEEAERAIGQLSAGLPIFGARAVEIGGTRYQAAMRLLPDGGRVIAAASGSLFAEAARVWELFFLVSASASLAFLVCAALLWRLLALPLRGIALAVERARWGREVPDVGRPRLREARAIADALRAAGEAAIEHERARAGYIADIVRAQEDERGRLARELHDGPLQTVVASIKRIQLARREAIGGSPLSGGSPNLEEAERIALSAADELRECCEMLSPSWVALGVASALEELAGRLSLAHGARVEALITGDPGDMPEPAALAVIRAAQEAVSNASRHGRATRVEIRLDAEPDCYRLTVTDDGRGFAGGAPPASFEELRGARHRGLSNIHERARLLGGTMEVTAIGAEPLGGASITLTLPRRNM